MRYRQLGSSGVRVSELCLGTMNFSDPTDRVDSLRLLGAALEAGINFVDTANMYAGGESERILGEGLRGRRDEVVLATKGTIPVGAGPNDGGSSRKHLRVALEASLRRLETDYVDVYYLHRPDPTCPLEESLAFCDDAVRAGKVLYVGVSNYWGWQIARTAGLCAMHGFAPLSVIQPVYSIVNRDCEVELLPAARELGLGVVCYSPLARGVLSGQYSLGATPPPSSRAARGNKRLAEAEWHEESFAVAAALAPRAADLGCSLTQLALAWVLANPTVTSPIIGPRTEAHLADNLGALELALPASLEDAVDALVPPGCHPYAGYRDPLYPVTGRPRPS